MQGRAVSYPTRAQLAARLKAQDVEASDGAVTDALAAAISAWERKTGWRPFLSTGEAETLTIPHYGGELLLPPGLAARSLDEGAPTTAGYALGSPTGHGSYRSLGWSYARLPGSAVQVTGVFGLVDEVPAEVREGILSLAAALARGAAGTAPEVTREKVGDVETQYAVYASADQSKLAHERLDELARAYKAWSF